MAFALVNGAAGHNFWQSPDGNGASGVATLNCLGSSSLFATIGDGDGTSTLGDSMGNTWVQGTVRGAGPKTAEWSCKAPATSSTLTFTVGATGKYPTLNVIAFSGGDQTALLDTAATPGAETGTNSGPSNAQPGSLTPSAADDLIISSLSKDGTAGFETIDSSFVLIEDHPIIGGQAYGGMMAYKIKTDALAENPLWAWAAGSNGGVSQTAYRAAAAVTDPFPLLLPGPTRVRFLR